MEKSIKSNAARLAEVEWEHGLDNLCAPAVYVGTYRKYNHGSLFGCWLDLTTFNDYEDFLEVCRYLHADEEDPELMFQDYQGFPESYYSESGMDEETFDVIQELANLSEDDQDAYSVFAKYTDAPTLEKFRDCYVGSYSSIAEYLAQDGDEEVRSFLGVDYDTLGRISSYIDYEAIARELDIEGWIAEDGYVFRSEY